jgi:hypothetical protein
MSTLFVGQSHVGAIRAAHQMRRASERKFKRTRGIHTFEERYRPEIEDADDPATARFGPGLCAELEQEIALYNPRIASMIGGNAHNALALVRHPRGYDFRLPGGAQGPEPEEGAEPIPFALMRAALAGHIRVDLLRLRLLRDVIGPFIHVESPPPLRDDAFIRAHADAHFRTSTAIDTLGVAPAGLRWRMWRLNSLLFREAVEALGGRFLPVPPAALDTDGFLRPDLAADATHGNADYGHIIITAVEELDAGD